MLEAMSHPIVLMCPDGHFRRVIFDLAAYIADYPEQVSLAGIVSGWCPKWVISLLNSLFYMSSVAVTFVLDAPP